ncbi:MAG TPA: serine/threonine-protein kinase [bacterium]|nr:serine/threonine-protein kinase [bacterium]HOM26223.1 serine/threonine-protein kinase [bacterium]
MEEYRLKLKGEIIEDYKIEEMIWHGGTSNIYKGVSLNSNFHKIVAIKVLHPHRNFSHQIKSFEKEFKILKKLSHPNILKVYKFGKIDKLYYIIMEYIDGMSLKIMLNEKAEVSPNTLLKILIKVGETIEYIHSKKIVHNDIKPENILISKNFLDLKLIDFGYAEKLSFFRKRVNYTGGTEKYIAPERKNGIIDFKSDIYSYGVMLEEILSGYDLIEEIYPVILSAKSENPEKRPHLKDIIKKLKAIYENWNNQ